VSCTNNTVVFQPNCPVARAGAKNFEVGAIAGAKKCRYPELESEIWVPVPQPWFWIGACLENLQAKLTYRRQWNICANMNKKAGTCTKLHWNLI